MAINSMSFTFVYLPLLTLCSFFLQGRGKDWFLAIVSAVLIFLWDKKAFFMLIIPLFDISVLMLMRRYNIKEAYFKKVIWFLICKSCFMGIAAGLFFNLETPLAVVLMLFDMFALTVYKQGGEGMSPLDFMLYILFFPKLFVGPFISPGSFNRRKRNKRFDPVLCAEGIMLFTWGCAKESMVINQLKGLISNIYHHFEIAPSVFFAWALVVLSFLRLYIVVSSYNDISRGICRIFSIDIPAPSAYPFFTPNIKGFVLGIVESLPPLFSSSLLKGRLRAGKKQKEYISLAFSIVFLSLILKEAGLCLAWGIYMELALLIDYFIISKAPLDLKGAMRVAVLLITLPSFAFAVTGNDLKALEIIKSLFSFKIPLFSENMLYFSASNLMLIIISFCLCFKVFQGAEVFSKKIFPNVWRFFALFIWAGVLILTASFKLLEAGGGL